MTETVHEAKTLSKETEIVLFMLEHIEGQVGRVDIKAQLTLTAEAFLIALISSQRDGILLNILDAGFPFWLKVEALLRISLVALLLWAMYFAFIAIIPKLISPQADNLYFFGSIAQMEEKLFIQKFLGQNGEHAKEALLSEIYTLSKVARAKYTALRNSHILLIIALVIWALNQVVLGFIP